MKGRVIKKLKSIPTISSLSLVFRTPSFSERYFQTPLPSSSKESGQDSQSEQEGYCNSSTEAIIIKDGEEQDLQGPGPCYQNVKEDARSKKTESPAENSLVEAGESADDLQEVNIKNEKGCPEEESNVQLLQEFEEKCPPGGNESVVFYTTSMRGIRKTFEDCNAVRFLLESFRIEYKERDVSLHLEYRDELWKVMGNRAVPPKLFIRGRYIGGADEVVGLHERGMLKKLLHGIPRTPNNTASCKGCAGVRFVLCFTCNGSRKIVINRDDDDEVVSRCPDCNENGLVKCPICNLIDK
ncbi:OLC1v1034030C1 [Oldenlandia corymbosa var. corymbosa]|uniref:OLC1v1034030C1 n=1 Tax=Oldenlandia corymbosa var. corymbosa TaxID=529605 RepID=A0AAV1CQZ2_OLDCO|nr:OLC1v1034030C1 [Oldenlandia corymbosa var. corymbosa]